MTSIRETLEREGPGWPEVVEIQHRFKGIEFQVNGHEIGDLHVVRGVEVTVRVSVRAEWEVADHVQLHQLLPQDGWVS